MTRVATNQPAVLQAVVARLIDQIPDSFGTANCYLCMRLQPPDIRIVHSLCCLVSPMGGEFDGSAMAGAGDNLVIEQSGVIVSVWSNIKLDAKQHAEAALNDATRGLLRLKGKILKALSGHDLLNGAGDQILVNLMAPVKSEHPDQLPEVDNMVGFSLMFSTDFEWDLDNA